MIAKAKVISHGSTAVNYSTKKELVDVIQFWSTSSSFTISRRESLPLPFGRG